MAPERKEPWRAAWEAQMKMEMGKIVRAAQDAIVATGWNNLSHEFIDPVDDDRYRLDYREGHYYVTNLTSMPDVAVEIDIGKLRISRDL